jgi:hypothetical protein
MTRFLDPEAALAAAADGPGVHRVPAAGRDLGALDGLWGLLGIGAVMRRHRTGALRARAAAPR